MVPVVVENAETLNENKYLIPPKEQKKRVINVLKSIGVTGSGCCSRMPIRDNVPLTP